VLLVTITANWPPSAINHYQRQRMKKKKDLKSMERKHINQKQAVYVEKVQIYLCHVHCIDSFNVCQTARRLQRLSLD